MVLTAVYLNEETEDPRKKSPSGYKVVFHGQYEKLVAELN